MPRFSAASWGCRGMFRAVMPTSCGSSSGPSSCWVKEEGLDLVRTKGEVTKMCFPPLAALAPGQGHGWWFAWCLAWSLRHSDSRLLQSGTAGKENGCLSKLYENYLETCALHGGGYTGEMPVPSLPSHPSSPAYLPILNSCMHCHWHTATSFLQQVLPVSLRPLSPPCNQSPETDRLPPRT